MLTTKSPGVLKIDQEVKPWDVLTTKEKTPHGHGAASSTSW